MNFWTTLENQLCNDSSYAQLIYMKVGQKCNNPLFHGRAD